MKTDNVYIDVKESAFIIGCSIATIRKYQSTGKLKGIKSAGKVYFKKQNIEEIASEFNKKQINDEEVTPEQPIEPVISIEELFSETLPEKLQIRRDANKKMFDLLEKNPPKTWLKTIGGATRENGTPVVDMPIEKIEFLMTYIFSKWWYEIREVKQILKSSIVVTVRVYYVDMHGDICYTDGVASTNIKIETEISKEIPKAAAMAMKNACKKLGRVFGRDINREIGPSNEKNENKKTAIFYYMKKKIESATDFSILEGIKSDVEKTNDEDLIKMYNEKEFELI